MKTRRFTTSVIAILFVALTLSFLSCNKDEGDSCADYSNVDKIVRVGAVVDVMKGSLPVDSVEIQIEITYLPCGSDVADPASTITGYTDTTGIFESPDPVTIIMNNDRDRIKFFALAPNLDYEGQNYAELYLYYGDFTGSGMETRDLSIKAKED